MKIKVRIFDIQYDTDNDLEVQETLPQEFITTFDVDDNLITDKDDPEDDELQQELAYLIEDYISDKTGFCHYGFAFDILDC